MSQIATIASSTPITACLAAALAGWAFLIIVAGLFATLSRDPERRDAAFRVLDRLLGCLPGKGGHAGSG